MMRTSSFFLKFGAIALAAAAFLGFAAESRADLTYYVILDVSSLSSNPNGPFSLDFQLATGSGNVTNSVTLSNFVLVGGGVTGAPNFVMGGATGDLTSSVVLTNSGQNNELAQEFSSSVTSISFKVVETSNSETVANGTPTPEQFSIFIDDSSGNFIPTTDAANSTLLTSAITATQTINSIQTFASLSPDGGVTVNASTVPELGSTGLLAFCAFSVLGLIARKERSAAALMARLSYV